MSVNAYLIFNGNCRDAALYYADVFETESPEIMEFGSMPAELGYEMSEDMKNLVMHTSLQIHESSVMFSDALPNSPVVFGKNITLAVISDELEKMKTEFERLEKDGKVTMPMQETPWSPAYGAVEDKYGIEWQFSYEDRASDQ